MSKDRRKWQGFIPRFPQSPDTVLAKLIQWTPGYGKGIATCEGTEPITLIGASAWQGLVPKDMLASEAFIFKDVDTGLWVQAVSTNLIKHEDLNAWLELQYTSGALAIWSNTGAIMPRMPKDSGKIDSWSGTIKPSYIARPITPMTTKFTIPRPKGQFIAQVALGDIPGRGKGRAKCIRTPQGIFRSATKAAAVIKRSVTYITTRAAEERQGFKYITAEEYNQHISQNPTTLGTLAQR